jgi:hypothetical protein
MCIVIAKPANIKLKREVYETCFTNNDDGAGIAYVKDDQLVIKKGFFQFDEFYKTQIEPNEDLELLIHFRVASPGMVVNADNCHPFGWTTPTFDDRYQFALVHNGRLEYDGDKTRSDTARFTDDVMKPHFDRDPFMLDHPVGTWMMERIINPLSHNNNKVCVLRYDTVDKKSDLVIIGKKKGTEAMGCWFSNTSFHPVKKVEHVSHFKGFGMDEYEAYSQYQYKEVDGKWTPYFQWNSMINELRMKLLTDPSLCPEFKGMTLGEQDHLCKVKLKFSCALQKEAKKVIELGNGEKEKKLAADFSIETIPKSDSRMKWLTKQQQRSIRRIAIQYCRQAVGVGDTAQWTMAQMIDWMRHDFRNLEVATKNLKVAELDKYILACDEQSNGAEWGEREGDAAKIDSAAKEPADAKAAESTNDSVPVVLMDENYGY